MSPVRSDQNIVLIGMPGVGKSTVGVLLAKTTSRNFIDTDVYIQARHGQRLHEVIDVRGGTEFLKLEESEILTLRCHGFVIATGGSVVYSEQAMRHLKSCGVVVHLDLAFDLLEKRLTNLAERGVVIASNQTLRQLYEERQPLYRRWADLTVDCAHRRHEQVVEQILDALDGFPA